MIKLITYIIIIYWALRTMNIFIPTIRDLQPKIRHMQYIIDHSADKDNDYIHAGLRTATVFGLLLFCDVAVDNMVKTKGADVTGSSLSVADKKIAVAPIRAILAMLPEWGGRSTGSFKDFDIIFTKSRYVKLDKLKSNFTAKKNHVYDKCIMYIHLETSISHQ